MTPLKSESPRRAENAKAPHRCGAFCLFKGALLSVIVFFR